MKQAQTCCKIFASLILLITMQSQAREILAVGTQFSRVFEQTPSGEYIGLGADVIRAFAKQNGDTVRFEIYPFQRAKQLVQIGKADIGIGLFKTPEREKHFAYAEHPFYQTQMVFYIRSGSTIRWSGDYTQLKNLRIYRILGWAYNEQFDRLDFPYFVTVEAGIKRLKEGEIDMLASNLYDTEEKLKTMKLQDAIKPIEPIIAYQNVYMVFSKSAKSDALRTQFDQVFDTMIKTGELAKMGSKNKVKIP